MINYQVITSRGKPRFAVVEYQVFMKVLEQLENQKINTTTNKQTRQRKEPTARELTRLMRSSPIKGWRLFRNMTQSELAEVTGLKQTHVSLMEANKIKPRKNTLEKLAAALTCDVDDLVRRQ
ncbi:MAG: helix-turn-helix transcriptional regulator [Candidatus Marinimicrobia bacterium]|nr:helix-turn-helix transcriptional regulator [Candidatus Neomarinimicrobiota bacterium]